MLIIPIVSGVSLTAQTKGTLPTESRVTQVTFRGTGLSAEGYTAPFIHDCTRSDIYRACPVISCWRDKCFFVCLRVCVFCSVFGGGG